MLARPIISEFRFLCVSQIKSGNPLIRPGLRRATFPRGEGTAVAPPESAGGIKEKVPGWGLKNATNPSGGPRKRRTGRRKSQTAPKSPALSVKVRIPTPDAMVRGSSRSHPMTLRGLLSVYGGLVPLGFSHSNSTVTMVHGSTFFSVAQSLFSVDSRVRRCYAKGEK